MYVRRVAKSGFRPPLDEHLPATLNAVIASCWAHDPKDRPR